MYFQQNLIKRLEGRYSRIASVSHERYDTELKYLLDFVRGIPYLQGLLQELEACSPEVTKEQVSAELRDDRLTIPDEEAAWAKTCYYVIQYAAEAGGSDNAAYIALVFEDRRDFNDMIAVFTREVVRPFLEHLISQIEESTNVLYLLEKYKRRTEWFDRPGLLDQPNLLRRIESDTTHSEEIADAHLRAYLFDQGIDYPFSTPDSPTGRADIVADVGEDDLLVLEVKLFAPTRTYGDRYVRKGFRQVRDYARDYGQTVGYLVVFNCSHNELRFDTQQGDRSWPSRIEVDNRIFYLVVIDLVMPEQSASKRRQLKPHVLTRDYLLAADEDGDELVGDKVVEAV